MPQSGVYAITNSLNGKQYIGSSADIDERWKDHRRSLRKGNSQCRVLQYAWNKYGEEIFIFTILQLVPDMAELVLTEQMFMDTCHPAYNTSPFATSRRGVICTPETIERIRQAATNPPAAQRKKMSDAKKGIAPTKAIEASIKSRKGKPRSQETINKIRETKLRQFQERRTQGTPPWHSRDEKGRFISLSSLP